MKVNLSAFLLAAVVLGGFWFGFQSCQRRTPVSAAPAAGSRQVVLYFADADGKTYAQRPYTLPGGESTFPGQVRAIVSAMAAKPAEPGAPSLWPAALSLRSAYVLKNDVLILDLDRVSSYNSMAGATTELQVIRSLVHTLLLHFPKLQQVKFLLDGFEQETLAGHVDITRPLGEDDLKP